MVILGLTGSIGMGKTTAAGMLRDLGVPVCDSDALVHGMLARGGVAVDPVGAAFAGVVRDGAVDRAALAAPVFDDQAALRRLEAIIHPLVRLAQGRFLRAQAARRQPLVALDVPLLFESGTHELCDVVAVVTAPAFLQAARVLGRPGMSPERLRGILARQMPDAEKRRRAEFVIQSGAGRRHTLQRFKRMVRLLRKRCGGKWPPQSRPGKLYA
jgi:dephospho-CoA kinase